MTSREVRRLVYHRLSLWADYLAHGYLPGQGDGIPSGNRPASRLPAPDWVFDLSRAFAALDGTAQLVVWTYYAPSRTAPPPDLTRADAHQWQHERERERLLALKAHDSARDADVAAVLHLAAWKARRLRAEAVWAIADAVNWDAPDA